MLERLLTIGVYGKSETEFFDQLSRAGVDLFRDIRQRRGVRGSQYARRWKPRDADPSFEERCYAQLSGWY